METYIIKASFLIFKQQIYNVSPCKLDALLIHEAKIKDYLSFALDCQAVYWKKKCNMNWFKDGDRNTIFFHVVVHKRHNVGGIFKLHHDDQIISYPKMIEDSILFFYTNLYVAPTNLDVCITLMQSFVASYIPSLVTNDENNFLIKCHDLDELKHAVFLLMMIVLLIHMTLVDVFVTLLWDIVGVDVYKVFQQFFWQGWILLGMNSNYFSYS